MAEIFSTTWGMNGNLGDVVLRRELFNHLRPHGRLHLLTVGMSAPYVAAMIEPHDIRYDDIKCWRSSVLEYAKTKQVVFVEGAGEINPTWRALRYLIRHKLLARALRRRGGRAALLGSAIRGTPDAVRRHILKLTLSSHELIYWRDSLSGRLLETGATMPDWAFAPAIIPTDATRSLLVVGLRGDRPAPSDAWVTAVREFAGIRRFDIHVVSQVAPDNTGAMLVAERLNAQCTLQTDDPSFEGKVMSLYASAAMVVSDRLHMLILAATAGAVPLCLTDFLEHKIGRHFDEIGFRQVAKVLDPETPARANEIFAEQLERRQELTRCVERARHRISQVEQKMASMIAMLPPPRGTTETLIL